MSHQCWCAERVESPAIRKIRLTLAKSRILTRVKAAVGAVVNPFLFLGESGYDKKGASPNSALNTELLALIVECDAPLAFHKHLASLGVERISKVAYCAASDAELMEESVGSFGDLYYVPQHESVKEVFTPHVLVRLDSYS